MKGVGRPSMVGLVSMVAATMRAEHERRPGMSRKAAAEPISQRSAPSANLKKKLMFCCHWDSAAVATQCPGRQA